MNKRPIMKPSGLAWTPEIPADWTVKKLGFLASLKSGNSITAEDIKEDGPYAVYGGNGLRGYTDRFTHEGEYALIGRQGALCGNINYAKGQFWASEHAVVVTPREEVAVRWLGELLRAMDLNQHSASAAQPGLAVETIAALKVPIPPLGKQRAIADYLDRETARIDALIDAKERVLALLAEKRRALITRAVTGGLDPHASLRDSGIPWLGEIPTHWRAQRLKCHLHRIEQGWSPQCEAAPAGPEDWGVLKAGCVNGDAFNPEENKRLPNREAPLSDLEIRPGDVLMSRANTTELLGSAAIVRDVRPRLLLCDKLYRLDVNAAILLKDFLVYFLRTPSGRFDFERTATGASNSMQNISQEVVRNVWLPVPPLEEQQAIVDHVTRETAKLDNVSATTERTIALLKERRSALIAAAVTGQINVEAVA